jgi:hypothetical protein
VVGMVEGTQLEVEFRKQKVICEIVGPMILVDAMLEALSYAGYCRGIQSQRRRT